MVTSELSDTFSSPVDAVGGPTTILRGGRVVDPAAGIDALMDVVVSGDRIVGLVAPADRDAAVEATATVIDVAGCLVTPGLIDLHVHVMPGLGDFCVEADEVGVGMGVPVLIDGGTSGVATFDLARRAIIDHPATKSKILAFIDPNQLYLATKDFICHKLEIANDARNIDVDSLAESLERNADVVIGMKVRACYTDDPTVSPFLEVAKRAAGELPIMVHLGRFPHTPCISTPTLLQALRGGDIITHAFRGGGGTLDASGALVPEFVDALERGLRLDIGHSGTDFRFREARRLFAHGVFPHTISTDLNIFNIGGPVFSLAETMTKIWAMDVDLVDVIAMCTSNAAASIRRSGEFGTLAPGRSAEISVLRIDDGPGTVSDGYETVAVERRLSPVGCLRAGTWYAPTSLGVDVAA
ncbi:MAG: amidohydrolase [Ilumatobacteraceae bacterium]|nr:amidohydrolase [Ilumatobacteraceae bacterium]